jgi:transposase-like protein
LRRRGKKAEERIGGPYLDDVLKGFSGYIAADEVYDGPFCVLSIVDNHRFRRLLYEVLDTDPTQADTARFFQRFRTELDARGLKLAGVTTDGSSLYPPALKSVFGDVAHQLCEFHLLQEINRAILKALAQVRREQRQTQPKLARGRPSAGAAQKAARHKKRREAKIAALFDHRYLFVQRALTRAEQRTFLRITRGFPRLRVLRSIADQVYRLFDRRCRTETALERLACLRRRIQRFQDLRNALRKLYSPNIEKALVFLNDSLLPATSNAVERGNRRHRKMQKSIYCVRTREHVSQRIAVDMHREAQAPGRGQTLASLHTARAESSLSR